MSYADDDRNHRAEMADHGQLALPRATAVNVAVAPAHRSVREPKISARDIEQRFAESGAPGLIANERRKDVALLQKHTAGHADRFLAAPDVNAAGDQAAAIKAGEFFLEKCASAASSETPRGISRGLALSVGAFLFLGRAVCSIERL